MAGIDKTYFKTWEQYQEVYEFCERSGRVVDDYGNKFYPLDFIAEWTKEELERSKEEQIKRYLKYYEDPEHLERDKKWFASIGEPNWEPDPENAYEFYLWNTPTYFDVWLIRNCEIDFIVERLKQQYGNYQNIKDRCSEYDKPRPKGSRRYRIFDIRSWLKFKDNLWWSIDIWSSENYYRYNEDTKMWYSINECRECHTSSFCFHGTLSQRKLSRLIKKWDLPVGTVLRILSTWKGNVINYYNIRIV